MVELQQIVIQACKGYEGTNAQIAELMGLKYSEFNNRLHMKNGTRFFDMDQLAYMQHVVGYPFLADYFASQFGMLVVDNPTPELVDNVDLLTLQMRADAARGLAAQGKLDAEEDGVVEYHELKSVTQSFMKSIRYMKQGVLMWAALHGMQAEAADLLVGRKVDAQEIAAPGHRRT
ncbi:MULTISPECIES: YmfL family putative regulatory protein [Erwiniaceae]|uniref:Uncharacterized protein n=1 Tax=Enterobacter agglomerans TaxID=549 RepID=A0ACC5RH19_ENTAG|nr:MULTISPECIES: YmfL family putative regulatory protein [Erwiniaceae]MBK4723934.1 hypothetical protein [Pantoea agglomerans]NKG32090.1 hypothetical protein [Erwinia rhapontici]